MISSIRAVTYDSNITTTEYRTIDLTVTQYLYECSRVNVTTGTTTEDIAIYKTSVSLHTCMTLHTTQVSSFRICTSVTLTITTTIYTVYEGVTTDDDFCILVHDTFHTATEYTEYGIVSNTITITEDTDIMSIITSSSYLITILVNEYRCWLSKSLVCCSILSEDTLHTNVDISIVNLSL